jgi:hypothetical protein
MVIGFKPVIRPKRGLKLFVEISLKIPLFVKIETVPFP